MRDQGFADSVLRVSSWWAGRADRATGPERVACVGMAGAYAAMGAATNGKARRSAGARLSRAVTQYHATALAHPIPSLDAALATYEAPNA
jgi:hypothetical protein